jgi:hypothetical protein
MSSRPPTVFISSTTADLGSYRAAARDGARKAGFEPILIEQFDAESRPPVEVDLDRVAAADVLVVIVAHRYGWVPNPSSGRSMTWLECERAVEKRMPVLAFLVEEDFPWPPRFVQESTVLRDFKEWLRRQFTVALFTTPEDLAAKVVTALTRWRGQQYETAAPPPAANPPITPLPSDDALMPALLFRLVAGRHAEPRFLNDLNASLFWEAVTKAAGSPQVGTLRDVLSQLEVQQQGIVPNPLWLAWVGTARREEIQRLLHPPVSGVPAP